MRASRGRDATNERVEVEAEAAEPKDEEESGDKPSNKEAEAAVDKASTKDGPKKLVNQNFMRVGLLCSKYHEVGRGRKNKQCILV